MNDFFVGISLYNTSKFLPVQITNLKNSIANSGLNIDLCYYDDGSNEASLEEITSIISKDKHIHFEHHRHRGFGSIHKNMEARMKNAKYSIFLDSDVFVPEYFFRALYQQMTTQSKDVGILSSKSIKIKMLDVFCIYSNGNTNVFTKDSYSTNYKKPELATQLASYMFAFETSKYFECGGVNPDFKGYFCDSDLCCKMACKNYKNYRIYFPQVFHVEHGTMLDENNKLDTKRIREQDLITYVNFWGDKPEIIEKKLLGNV